MSTTVTLTAAPFTTAACTGEVIPVRVLLAVDGDAINAAQGTLRYDPSQLRIESVRTGGSIFRFWQTQPTVDASRGTITFVGGLPTPGYDGTDGLLFTVNVVPLGTGDDVRMSWGADTVVLLNDGEGTPTDLALTGMRVSVAEASSTECTAARPTPTPVIDVTPPEPFDVIITRTEDAFRGQYFASFYAYDKDSGVVRYEVRENGETWHAENSPYLLRTQSGPVMLEVKAVDAFGLERIGSMSADLMRTGGFDLGPWWFWLIALIAAGLGIWRYLASRRNKKDEPKPQNTMKSSVIYRTEETGLE